MANHQPWGAKLVAALDEGDVVDVPGDTGDDLICAVVLNTATDHEAAAGILAAYCRRMGLGRPVPDRFLFWDGLPRDAKWNPDRDAIRARVTAH